MLRHNSFHIYIAKKILEECKEYSYVLKRDKVRRRLWLCHIPLELHNDFLKDLEELKLIQQDGKFDIIILKDNIERFYFKE